VERIPVSVGYRRELTFRFRLGIVSIILFFVAREYLRVRLGLDLCRLPFEAFWNPPARNGSQEAVALVEFLNYAYVFLFVMWIRDGLVLSFDFVGLKIQDAWRKVRPGRQAFSSY
jgi:hypothetical protein